MRNDRRVTVFDRRFNGLPGLAHGGYVAGVLASELAGEGAEVRLRRPVVTGRRLSLERTDDERVELRDGDALLAEAVSAELSLEVPLPVTLADAEAAAKRYCVHGHPFPHCFACGPERGDRDGLRIFTGPVTGRRLVAAPWLPVPEAAGESGRVPDELVWAAFDCPQLWALIVHPPAGAPSRVVTASLAARIERRVRVGEPHVVIAWPIGRDGRRVLAGAAVFGPDGELCAVGRQTAAPAGWGVPLDWLSGATRTANHKTTNQRRKRSMTTYETSAAATSGPAELKRTHRKIWASGSYAAVAERIVDEVPPRHLLGRVSIEPGMEVLDLAAGTGNVAIRAAQLGARVTALDLTPELFERGRERAAEAGVDVEWVEGDAEDLPFEDGRFDRVLSTFGIQFAPRHEAAAREAVRVTRPGGLIGLVNWTPQSHIGRVLKAVGSRLPKPPDFASPPPLWGDEAHVRQLLEPAGVELEFERAPNPFIGFGSPDEWVEFMETNYGPLLTARTKLAPDGRWDELREELVALTASLDQGRPGAMRVESEYLLAIGRVLSA